MTAREHLRLTTQGIELHAVAAGPADGELVLLLHGFPEFWYGWHRQIAPLAAAGYRVLVPDQRGYNLSAKPRGVAAYRLDVLAQDAIGLLDALGRERALVAGHDWGAAVAWWAALRHPERIRRLAVLNVPHPAVMRRFLLTSPAQIRRSWYIFCFQLPWLPELWFARNGWHVATRSLHSTARPGTFTPHDLDLYRQAWSQPGALRAMLAWYRAALRHVPRSGGSPRIRIPTLVLWGGRDRYLSQDMIPPSLALCDHGEVEVLPDAGHWLQHEQPEVVSARLLQWFCAEPAAA